MVLDFWGDSKISSVPSSTQDQIPKLYKKFLPITRDSYVGRNDEYKKSPLVGEIFLFFTFLIPESTFFISIEEFLIRETMTDVDGKGSDKSSSMRFYFVYKMSIELMKVISLETLSIRRVGNDGSSSPAK